jgi:SAM-dependent methyltransferase
MKALVAIASYGSNNDRYLRQLVEEYRSMSFPVDIVVVSNATKDLGPDVEVLVVDLRNKDPWSLPFAHKQIFAERINRYDLFVYSEDDTLVTERNLRAFLEASAVLPDNEIPGFLRFEKSPGGAMNLPEIHGHFHWDPQSVRERNEDTFAFFTNEHAACYVLTRNQLQKAVESGGYLVEAHNDKYDLLCTCATDPYTQCGMKKFICISRVDEFLIHHLPNKYVCTSFGIGEAEFRKQLDRLMHIGSNGCGSKTLFPTETKLPASAFSKSYYEAVRSDLLEAIPAKTQRVLSVGCGTGAIEATLKRQGKQVVAVALDPVIPSEAINENVELVIGSLEESRQKLGNLKFDCLLLSNILHLIPDPQRLLQDFAEVLCRDATVVVLTPNLAGAAVLWKRFRGDARVKGIGNYETSGVHLTSPLKVRNWLSKAGMTQDKRIDILPPQRQKFERVAWGVFRPFLSAEFIVVARKA